MIRIILYYALLAFVVLLAFRRGDRETRVAAIICLVASLLSLQLMSFRQQVEVGVAIVDLLVLGSFVFIALRTDRFWPLWVSGLQLTTVTAHLMRLIQPDLIDIAYAAAMRFWSYPILLILVAAALRSRRYIEREAQRS
jgi:hypothetical protein